MFEGVPDAAVVLAIGDSARAENIARAHATFQKIIYLIVIKRPKPQIHYAAAASDRYA
jgi:hypothetical protein